MPSPDAAKALRPDTTSAVAAAVDDAVSIQDVRAELHNTKGTLLDHLRSWRESVDERNSFLAIYSHMFAQGMSPKGTSAELVTWDELKAALRGVHTLWLIGCDSQHAMTAWPTPKQSPVRGTMLATSARENWLDLVSVFGREVSVESIVPFDRMEGYVRDLLPQHGSSIHYYDAAQADRWEKFVCPSSGFQADAAFTALDPEQLSAALWGDWSTGSE